jgi:hypothetical protein
MLHKFVNLLLLVLLLLTYSYASAETSVVISWDTENLEFGDNFNINVDIETDSTWSLEIVNIDWLNSFQTLWQQSSKNINVINWERLNTFKLWISLVASNTWTYVIWPAKLQIGDKIILSNVLNITINNEVLNNLNNSKIKYENKDKLINNSDNDIRWIQDPNSRFYNFILLQLFIIFLLIWVYIYYAFFLNKKSKSIHNDKDAILTKKKKIIKWLLKLKKNIDAYSKSNFYELLNSYFREYFEILWIRNSDKLTLSEIKELDLNKSLISLFEKSYLNEFSNKKDLIKEKIELIDKLIKTIK